MSPFPLLHPDGAQAFADYLNRYAAPAAEPDDLSRGYSDRWSESPGVAFRPLDPPAATLAAQRERPAGTQPRPPICAQIECAAGAAHAYARALFALTDGAAGHPAEPALAHLHAEAARMVARGVELELAAARLGGGL